MADEKRLFVLIAEDDPDGRHIYSEVIEKTGFKVDYAFVESGRELLDFLRDNSNPRPSLVVVDLKFSVDRNTLESMRDDMQTRSIPVAVITTREREPAIRKTYCDWDDCMIVKPVGIQPFQDVIDQVFARWFGPIREIPQAADLSGPSLQPQNP